MKKFRTLTILTFAFIIITFSFNAKSEYPITSIAVIDLNLILAEAKAAKKASEEIEGIALEIENSLKASEEELIKEQDELAESQAVMTPESFEDKMVNFQKKVQNFNISKQDRLQSLDNMIADARLQVLQALEPILEQITEEKGLTIILDKNIVLLNTEKMDITKEALKKLNKELSNIKISKE